MVSEGFAMVSKGSVERVLQAAVAILLAVVLPASAAQAESFDHSYASYDAMLRAHVDDGGLVDYQALGKDRRLARFVSAVAEIDAEQLAGWGRDQQVAFLINAYNAVTLQTIVDVPGVSSIRDIKPDPWEAARWQVGGRKVSLNFIEHTRLRGQFREERVHFVLVCAARGCPVLPRRALRAEKLSEQLDSYARAFVRDPQRNRIDRGGGKLHLSRLFQWYADDFKGGGDELPAALLALPGAQGGVLRYIYPLLDAADQRFIADGKFEVVYADYDWSLNAR